MMAEEQKGTAYVVLSAMVDVRVDDLTSPKGEPPSAVIEGAWRVVDGTYTAPNDVAAIKAAEKETGQKFDHGAVAVPARSWRPRMPKDEMVPRRLWS
jgi:hypothetical protein